MSAFTCDVSAFKTPSMAHCAYRLGRHHVLNIKDNFFLSQGAECNITHILQVYHILQSISRAFMRV